MKLCVFSPVFGGKDYRGMLEYLAAHDVKAVELGCGGYPGTAHADAKELVKNPSKAKEFKKIADDLGIEIAALSAHGNMVHPNKAVAQGFRDDFEAAVHLAAMWGVERVVTISGCPGDSPASQYPNWVTCAWPNDFGEILNYQWNDVLIPFWQKEAEFVRAEGVKMIPLEMHPGFCCYNPETLLHLRSAVGNTIGANVDPSHLVWQGIDPAEAVKTLGGAVQFFHAKDTAIDRRNTQVNGVLDTKPYADEAHRSWVFRTVGYGMDEGEWRRIFSALNLIGYDHVLSIEHEDSLMDGMEGLEKAIAFLKGNMIVAPKPNGMWWA
jgi:sugar phosphate isomerase/epimerase